MGGSEGDARWDLLEVPTQNYVADHTGALRNCQRGAGDGAGVIFRTAPPLRRGDAAQYFLPLRGVGTMVGGWRVVAVSVGRRRYLVAVDGIQHVLTHVMVLQYHLNIESFNDGVRTMKLMISLWREKPHIRGWEMI